jgi:NADP-dependent 3-hydroxy acid dehydrogenase YdfG
MPERAALVTGASSGIGFAIADLLGQEGHALTLAARRPDKLSVAVEELRGKGYEVEEVAANLTGEEDVQRVVSAHRERFGRLDVLVNSAGVGVGAPVADMCPGFVDTPMTDFVREHVPSEQMIQPSDITEAVRFLLRTSAHCRVPEIVFERPGETI